MTRTDNPPCTPSVELSESTVERLDDIRIDDESYDEIVAELITIYEAAELTVSFAGDHVGGQ